MNTRKYNDTGTRATIKRQQRTAAYRELQRRAAEERSKIEATIKPLKEDRAKLHALEALWNDETAVKNRLDSLAKERGQEAA